MRVAMFSAKHYVRTLLEDLDAGHRHELVYFDTLLGPDTASLATGFPAVSVSVNDVVDRDVLKQLAAGGTRLVATLSTGFNHIDVGAAHELGVKVVRVADYSPHSVAEFAVGHAADADRVLRVAVQKVCRPVEWVDDPDQLALSHPLRRQLFTHDDGFRRVAQDDFGDHGFGGAVDFRHEIVL